jgi:hypothetical protein
MVIAAAAFCPHPPVLVPALAQDAAPELDGLRSACRDAITRIAGSGRPLVVLGGGTTSRRYPATSRGTFAGFGVPLEVPLGSEAEGPVELPLSLTVGAWLLRDALGPDCGATGYGVAPGDLLPQLPDGSAALIMGDGSARRSTAAPGYLHDRAAEYDRRVAEALGTGTAYQLNDGYLEADGMLAAGATVWDAVAAELEPFEWDAELLYDNAPYGVGYFVAAWTNPR